MIELVERVEREGGERLRDSLRIKTVILNYMIVIRMSKISSSARLIGLLRLQYNHRHLPNHFSCSSSCYSPNVCCPDIRNFSSSSLFPSSTTKTPWSPNYSIQNQNPLAQMPNQTQLNLLLLTHSDSNLIPTSISQLGLGCSLWRPHSPHPLQTLLKGCLISKTTPLFSNNCLFSFHILK